jgi:F-type H+-transporting ATPase subunit gamma
VAEVKIISTKFTTVFSQTPTITDILPIKLSDEKSQDKNNVMLFEPNLTELLPSLLQHYLEMVIYQSLLENYASEQAARMLAMKNATDNALEVIEELKLDYNKSRQEKITNEILDIGSAAFAYAD